MSFKLCPLLTGGAHSFRTIFMDGRAHPANLSPSDRGHSVGHWEGDTLVVDSVGFSERVWIDNLGVPTTEQLHMTEKFTRTDFNSLRYEIIIDDPGAYAKPWIIKKVADLDPGIVDPRMAAEAVSLTFLQCTLKGLQRKKMRWT